MQELTAEALEAWNNRENKMVFTTVGTDGMPNSIWVLCAKLIDNNKLVVANNAMSKTLDNVENGCKGSLLYIAPEREAYQLKGTLEHHKDGPVFDAMKQWLDPKFPGHSAVLMDIEEIYYGANKIA